MGELNLVYRKKSGYKEEKRANEYSISQASDACSSMD
jgi:hypothetical protein